MDSNSCSRITSSGAQRRAVKLISMASHSRRSDSATASSATGRHAYHGQKSGDATNTNASDVQAKDRARLAESVTRKLAQATNTRTGIVTRPSVIALASGASGERLTIQLIAPKG